MRIITKLFVAVLACAAITLAQTGTAANQTTTSPATQQVAAGKGKQVTGVPQKPATNWTKIKDLFL
jgi:hypothetical protein